MSAVLTMARKDLRLLWRDRAGFFFTFGFPLVYAVFFGAIMSGMGDDDTRLRVVVTDEDATSTSQAFVQRLVEADALEVQLAEAADAERIVRRGKALAYIRVPPGFGAASDRVFWGPPPELETGIDPSRRAEAGLLQGMLTQHMAARFEEAFADPARLVEQLDGAMGALGDEAGPDALALRLFLPALKQFLGTWATTTNDDATASGDSTFEGFIPVKITARDITRQRRGPMNAYAITFPQAIVWGVMGCAAAFGISLVVERTRGTLLRLCAAPLSRRHVLFGKALACFATTSTVAAILLTLGITTFGLRPHDYLLLLAAVFSMAIAFVGLMMLLSTLGRTEQSAGGIGWAVFMILAMIGGGMLPLAFLPSGMRTLSNISPVKWSIYAMEGALWRQLTWPEVLPACGILIGCGVACFALGQRLFRWE